MSDDRTDHTVTIHGADASAESARLLADLGWRTFDDTFAPHTPRADMDLFLSTTFTPEKLLDELIDTRNEFYLAYVGDEPAAYLQVSTQTDYLPECVAGPKPFEIARLYVDKPFKRMGIGSTLMEHVLNIAHSKGCQTLWLSVWEHNEPAKTFYLNWGFRFVGSHPYPVGNDPQIDLLMRREI